jgi:hypothetical protein
MHQIWLIDLKYWIQIAGITYLPTGRTVHDDHFGVVVEPLGRPVDEMKQIVEAYCLIGPGLEAGLQHPARLAVDVCLRNLSRGND